MFVFDFVFDSALESRYIISGACSEKMPEKFTCDEWIVRSIIK